MPNLRKTNVLVSTRDGISYIFQIVSLAVGFAILIITVTAAVIAILVCNDLRHVPDLAFLKDYHPNRTIQIFDHKDKLVCAVEQDVSRVVVPLKKIPLYMQQAVLAAEDRHFYEHSGINFKSLVRAAYANMQARQVVEGGSTITQQLVKNLFFLDTGRSADRKIAEALVATELEKRYSKPEILQIYLNEIYFGNGANGIQQAAQRYFGKNVWELNLSESAFIAGLIRSPSTLGSPEHRDEAILRQRQILDGMAECGFITHAQGQHAKFYPLYFHSSLEPKPQHAFNVYPYYVSYVLDLIKLRYPETVARRQGIKVFTNLDQVAQQCGEKVLAQEIKHAPAGITQEALIAISVKDGGVRAIVGGAGDYWTKQWNCATNPHTVGSTFKPFVYLTAFLEHALGPNSLIDDTPLTVHQVDSADYSPKNYDGKFLGKIPVRKALAQSRNVCAVRAAQMVGMSRVLSIAREAGITGDIAPNISSALGSSALSPLDLAGAYGTFARGGVVITPRALRRVESMNGELLENFDSDAHRVFPEEEVSWLVSILQEVVNSGTGMQARLGDRPAAGKTGTADKATDLWFVGFTPDMVTAVWGGNDNNLPIANKHVTGGTVMARLWRQYNKMYYSRVSVPPGAFLSSQNEGAVTDIKDLPDDSNSTAAHAVVEHKTAGRRRPKVVHHFRAPRMFSGHKPSNPDGGVAVRRAVGVTEYSWGR
ncbi:MAG: PBP1A family penicillin-binding protein [Candidatus Melainabacteria bacterium]|nr:MAG: PBP1A family penicillin-binding protein [Candidatus Melainabacteria bacterium]